MSKRPNTSVDRKPLAIEFADLETFIAVADTGSFSSAAGLLHVSQPAVTGRIKRLEEAVGSKLLRRTSRKVETTVAGAVLLVEAAEALSSLRRVVGRLRGSQSSSREQVIVATTPGIAARILPPLIRDFLRSFPSIDVVLRDVQYREALSMLTHGDADVAVLSFDENRPEFRTSLLKTDEIVLAVPKGHLLDSGRQIALEQLSEHTCLVTDRCKNCGIAIGQHMMDRQVAPMSYRTVANLNTLLGMLDAGLSAVLAPRCLLRGEKHTKIEIPGIHLTRSISLVEARKSTLSKPANEFRRFLSETIR
jgi:DNA-binding transcriptional LysR family regulator